MVGYVHLKDIVSALASGKRPSACASWCASRSTRPRTPASSGCGASSSAGACTSRSSSAPGTRSRGIVTLEDLLEEFVGEIQDEQDAGEIPPIVRNADGSFEVDGRLTLDVAAREIGVAFPAVPPEVETLGGFIITQLPEAPVPGDVIAAGGFRFTVLAVRDRRIRRLHAVPLPAAEPVSEGERATARRAATAAPSA